MFLYCVRLCILSVDYEDISAIDTIITEIRALSLKNKFE